MKLFKGYEGFFEQLFGEEFSLSDYKYVRYVGSNNAPATLDTLPKKKKTKSGSIAGGSYLNKERKDFLTREVSFAAVFLEHAVRANRASKAGDESKLTQILAEVGFHKLIASDYCSLQSVPNAEQFNDVRQAEQKQIERQGRQRGTLLLNGRNEMMTEKSLQRKASLDKQNYKRHAEKQKERDNSFK